MLYPPSIYLSLSFGTFLFQISKITSLSFIFNHSGISFNINRRLTFFSSFFTLSRNKVLFVRLHLQPLPLQLEPMIQEFLTSQLSSASASHVLTQIQTCHSAVEDLLLNLESLRSAPKAHLIEKRVQKLSAFLATREQLMGVMGGEQSHPVTEWLLQEKLNSPLLQQMGQQQQKQMDLALNSIGKNVFLEGEAEQSQQQLLEDCLGLLLAVQTDMEQGRLPPRDKLKVIDGLQPEVEAIMTEFHRKTDLFSRQVNFLIGRLQQLEASIAQQFKMALLPQQPTIKQQPQEENELRDSARKRVEMEYTKTTSNYAPTRYRPQLSEGWAFANKPTRQQPSQLGLNSRINQREGESFLRGKTSSSQPKAAPLR